MKRLLNWVLFDKNDEVEQIQKLLILLVFLGLLIAVIVSLLKG